MPEDEKKETPEKKGSLMQQIKKMPKWAWIGVAGVGVVIIIIYERSKSSSSNTSTVGVSPTDAAAQGLSTQNMDGYPLDSSYDSSGYGYNNPQSGATGTLVQPPTANGNPPTVPNPVPPTSNSPLIPPGQYNGPSYSPGQFQWGEEYTYNGINYQIAPGSNGILWGVPLTNGQQPYSQSQFNNIPIQPGGKVQLYGGGGGIGGGSMGATGYDNEYLSSDSSSHNDTSQLSHLLTLGSFSEDMLA